MFHTVSLEGIRPGKQHLSTVDRGSAVPQDGSSVLARTPQWGSPSSYSVSQRASQAPSSPLQPVQPAHLSQNNRILVIDDSLTTRKILEICLIRKGFQVLCFADGVAAIRWLLQPGAILPALIILDINLPKMNGYDIARYLKTKPAWQPIIVILLTRRDGIVDRLKGRLVGANEYLSKPFTSQTITDVVESYVGVPMSHYEAL